MCVFCVCVYVCVCIVLIGIMDVKIVFIGYEKV